MSTPPNIQVLPDAATLARVAADAVVRYVQEPLVTRGVARVALAGGQTPRKLYQLLAGPPHTTRLDYSLVHFYFTDERCVPADDPQSNYGMARETLLTPAGIPEGNAFRIDGELPPAEAADAYESLLHEQLGDSPAFDLVLLGLGEDGHTAGLFPGGPELNAAGRVAASRAPTAPADRVTLTLNALADARQVLFIVSGKHKADAVARALAGEDLPATRVATAARARWLLDAEAASQQRS